LFGIDRLMSTCTALTNMIGNTVAVFALAKWERAFDVQQFRAYQNARDDARDNALAVLRPELQPEPRPAGADGRDEPNQRRNFE
jgi:aerobic C4-dicarboxylate transport protein